MEWDQSLMDEMDHSLFRALPKFPWEVAQGKLLERRLAKRHATEKLGPKSL